MTRDEAYDLAAERWGDKAAVAHWGDRHIIGRWIKLHIHVDGVIKPAAESHVRAENRSPIVLLRSHRWGHGVEVMGEGASWEDAARLAGLPVVVGSGSASGSVEAAQ